MARKKYKIELEIYESGCPYHKIGDKFSIPQDKGKICSWLYDSANTMIRILEYDGKLPWGYQGTPYEKIINKDGVTTEFVRCPDPTSAGVVLKITRTKLPKDQIKTFVP
ncbi:MAG: TIGR04076 family protein [Asgard group archaeon]|nr:TIGR04076 family protein [Asgard group archaeon]